MFKFAAALVAATLWCTTIYVFAITKPNCRYANYYGRDLCSVADRLSQEMKRKNPKQYDPDIFIDRVASKDDFLEFSGKMKETKSALILRIWGHQVTQKKIDTFLSGHITYGICQYKANKKIKTFLYQKGRVKYKVYDAYNNLIGVSTIFKPHCPR
ncbi:hypothetical protein [Larsenimonas suaedae]|uniref:Uncharacterized protein n=1 Tax=Larsenimonas suaedae TaxID=1851019 RepID=A0ABU1H0L2_9GAMM|nr:hypothetical protein [Larsenimonas suaedae]MCM2973778.1 hypothetical protein [Larsenimonas suaedae]MDR5897302.1 hypothetical protein [Larsenimonas suaedae]